MTKEAEMHAKEDEEKKEPKLKRETKQIRLSLRQKKH
jgi:hypothetical protein